LSFNSFGQASRVRESGHSAQDGSWRKETETLLSDSNGRTLLSHSKGSSSVAGDHDVWTTTVDEAGRTSFNAFGESTYQLETGTRHGLGAFTRTTDARFSDSFDAHGQLLHSVETLHTASLITTSDNRQTFNSFGQLVSKDTTSSEKISDSVS